MELQVSVFQGENKKAVRVNGMKRDRVMDLLGQFNAVFFGALDLNIVTGEPTDRRHYLNVEISQISPRYVVNMGHYKRVLQQRNRLLRDLRDRPRPPADLGLDAWTEQLGTLWRPPAGHAPLLRGTPGPPGRADPPRTHGRQGNAGCALRAELRPAG